MTFDQTGISLTFFLDRGHPDTTYPQEYASARVHTLLRLMTEHEIVLFFHLETFHIYIYTWWTGDEYIDRNIVFHHFIVTV